MRSDPISHVSPSSPPLDPRCSPSGRSVATRPPAARLESGRPAITSRPVKVPFGRAISGVLCEPPGAGIDQITQDLAKRQLPQLLAADAVAVDRLRSELGRYDNPDQHPAGSPVFIAQGTTDSDVPVGATDGLVTQLCSLGDHVDYRRYVGLDHEAVVRGSLPEVTAWINHRFEGRDPPNTCPATNASGPGA